MEVNNLCLYLQHQHNICIISLLNIELFYSEKVAHLSFALKSLSYLWVTLDFKVKVTSLNDVGVMRSNRLCKPISGVYAHVCSEKGNGISI